MILALKAGKQMRQLIITAMTIVALSCAVPTLAEPPGKPAFLQQGNNADVAYCLVVLKDSKYRKDPKNFNLTLRYVSTAAYLDMILEERGGAKWPELSAEVMQWTAKAIEEDLATNGALRLSPDACLDLAATLRKADSKSE